MTPREMEPLRVRYRRIGMTWAESRYDTERNMLLEESGGSPLVAESLQYARLLLDSREEANSRKAEAIIGEALGHYGRGENAGAEELGEEPGAMSIVRMDASQIPLQALLEILFRHSARLGKETARLAEKALGQGCRRESRTWASPELTSSALLSAQAALLGGEWLREREIADAGIAKLEAIRRRFEGTGAFDEFNSPSRAGFSLRALGLIRSYARDERAKESAERLWRAQWLLLLECAHGPTGQLAGPHCRAAGRDMRRDGRGPAKYFLHRALGTAFPLGAESSGGPGDLFPAMMADDPDCPEDLRETVTYMGLPRTVCRIYDSRVAYPAVRGEEEGAAALENGGSWAAQEAGRGTPGHPSFVGYVRRYTAYMGERICLGSASAAAQTPEGAALLAHWPSGKRDRANYLVALVLKEGARGPVCLDGALLCFAQLEGRVLGLLRFELSAQGDVPPRAEKAYLSFQVNADCSPEVMARGESGTGTQIRMDGGVVIRGEGVLVGLRVLRLRLPGSRVRGEIADLPSPLAHPEGELGVRLAMEPLSPKAGRPAYVAFACEVGEERSGEGITGMLGRLRAARVAEELEAEGRIRLSWGADLSLETSTRVLEHGSALSREGEVRN